MDGENLEDIFDEYATLDNERGEHVEETTTTLAAANEAEGEQSAGTSMVHKRIVRNPRPKLNAERLCGKRGLPAIPKHFENVKFKGKGHEKDDLDRLLSTLEHWAHRLFPRLKFADCLEHIEKLGKKKPVQVCMKKLRLDMPLLTEDFIHETVEDNDIQQQYEAEEDTNNSELIFDQLIKEHQESTAKTQDSISVETEISSPLYPDDSTSDIFAESVKTSTQHAGYSSEMILTDEQKARIERNRRFAEERRKAKLAAIEHSITETHLTDTLKSKPLDIQNNIEFEVNICNSSGTVKSDISSQNLTTSICKNIISLDSSSEEKAVQFGNMNTDETSAISGEADSSRNDNLPEPVDIPIDNISDEPTNSYAVHVVSLDNPNKLNDSDKKTVIHNVDSICNVIS